MAIDYEKEVAEAVNAANDALYYLTNADEMLSKARNWGIADIMGGGIIITAIKRQRMQEASREIDKAKRSLSVLKKELGDLDDYLVALLQCGAYVALLLVKRYELRLGERCQFLAVGSYLFDVFFQ